jgi:CheY-specific phosphatase CheX
VQPPLSSEIIQRFLSVVSRHLRHTVGVEAVLAAIGDSTVEPDTIAVTLDFIGDVRGPMTWVFPESIALELVRRLMADPDPAPELAADGAAELANILTGRASEVLEAAGFRCEFGVPRIVQGEIPPGITMRMSTAGGPIDLILSMSRTRRIPIAGLPRT